MLPRAPAPSTAIVTGPAIAAAPIAARSNKAPSSG
jgi:hypothetical protein